MGLRRGGRRARVPGERGLGREVLEQFGVGYAPSAWDRVLMNALQAGFTEQELQAAGLAQKGRQGGIYDRFRARIMFPLRDARGRVLGFGARATRDNQQPKYVNSSEGPVYRKGRQLFGLDLARSHITKQGRCSWSRAIRTCLPCTRPDFANAVAAMGTALTEEQLGELARLAREVLLAFDADRSGQEAMLRAQRAAAGRGVVLKVVRLPDDKDPCDLLVEAGPDSFKTRAGAAIPFLEFQVTSALGGCRHALSAAGQGQGRGRARARVLRRAALGRAGRADPPCGGPARPLGAPARAAAGAPPEGAPVRTTRLGDRAGASRVERNERCSSRCASRAASGGASTWSGSWTSTSRPTCCAGPAPGSWSTSTHRRPDSAHTTSRLMNAVSEIVVRASSAPASEHALEFGFLGLEKHRLEREIKAACGESRTSSATASCPWNAAGSQRRSPG